jgi:tyrosyl-tRNA synthetase
MKREAHPMQAKKDLARRIVTDFHSAEAAAKAGEDWAKQFQKDEVPEDIDSVNIRLADVQVESQRKQNVLTIGIGNSPAGRSLVRLDKLIRQAGLAGSNSEAGKLLKSGAVAIEGEAVSESTLIADVLLGHYFFLRVGRRMKRVRVVNGSVSN